MAADAARDSLPIPDQRHADLITYDSTGTEFTGRVNWVQIDVDEAAEDIDHLISPEDRLRVAFARQ